MDGQRERPRAPKVGRMRKWLWAGLLVVTIGLGVVGYFWFYSGLWWCPRGDASVDSLSSVGAATAYVVEVDDPTVTIHSGRCVWSAEINGSVSAVLFDDTGKPPTTVFAQIFGKRADDYSPLKRSEPVVLSFGYSGGVTAASDRPDDGPVVWLTAGYVEPAMPDTVAEWVAVVIEAHDSRPEDEPSVRYSPPDKILRAMSAGGQSP